MGEKVRTKMDTNATVNPFGATSRNTRNQIELAGYVGKDEPELRYLQDGTPMLTFNLATNSPLFGGGERTDWHCVTLFGAEAERLADTLHARSAVQVIGRIRTRKNQAADGRTFKNVGITADQVLPQEAVGRGKNSVTLQGYVVGKWFNHTNTRGIAVLNLKLLTCRPAQDIEASDVEEYSDAVIWGSRSVKMNELLGIGSYVMLDGELVKSQPYKQEQQVGEEVLAARQRTSKVQVGSIVLLDKPTVPPTTTNTVTPKQGINKVAAQAAASQPPAPTPEIAPVTAPYKNTLARQRPTYSQRGFSQPAHPIHQ